MVGARGQPLFVVTAYVASPVAISPVPASGLPGERGCRTTPAAMVDTPGWKGDRVAYKWVDAFPLTAECKSLAAFPPLVRARTPPSGDWDLAVSKGRAILHKGIKEGTVEITPPCSVCFREARHTLTSFSSELSTSLEQLGKGGYIVSQEQRQPPLPSPRNRAMC